MIKLKVEKCCHECPYFEVDVETTSKIGMQKETIISCAHRDICAFRDKYRDKIRTSDNRCICCGDIIPEGRQVCKICEIIERDD